MLADDTCLRYENKGAERLQSFLNERIENVSVIMDVHRLCVKEEYCSVQLTKQRWSIPNVRMNVTLMSTYALALSIVSVLK